MKRIINLTYVVLLLILNGACHKDKNTYDYGTFEVITVEGIEQSYSVISQKDTLRVNATATSNLPGADFEYLWGIYETNAQGYPPVLDTISRQKELVYRVALPAKTWVLVHVAKNKTTGLSHWTRVDVRVNTEFTRGWYVMKDNEVATDMDLFLTPTSIVPVDIRPNIYSQINNERIDGKGLMFNFLHDYKTTAENPSSPLNTRTLFLVTDKDVRPLYINTLKPLFSKDNILLGGGAVDDFRGEAVFYGFPTQFLIANGHLHTINAMSLNRGQFGLKIMFDELNSPYQLSRFFLAGSDPYLFCDVNSSFVTLSQGYGSIFTRMTDHANSQLTARNNNKKLLYMGYKNQTYLPAPEYRFVTVGYALFEDKTNPALRGLARLSPDRAEMNISYQELGAVEKLYDSDKHTLLIGDEEMMYFVYKGDGNVYSRNLANGNEQLQFVVPSGEEVTFIRHRKYGESGYAFNYVMVGTKVGSNYKVRMFEKQGGNLLATPSFVLEGEGIPRDAIYISPSVSGSTYTSSY